MNRLEFFVKISGFSLVFYPKFSILQNNIHEKTRIFFLRLQIFETREEYGLFSLKSARKGDSGAKDPNLFCFQRIPSLNILQPAKDQPL
jgi:hypothetical protein